MDYRQPAAGEVRVWYALEVTQPQSVPLSPAGSRNRKSGLAYWAERVLQECDKASAGFEADAVHDLRVAIRRCRSMADGFLSVDPDPAWKQMKRVARPLFRSLGDLRDTQVMGEWLAKLAPAGDPVAEKISTCLRDQEAQLKTSAEKELAKFDRGHWQSLNEHLAKRTGNLPLEGLIFQHLALERWIEAREFHRKALRNRSATSWHQLRIGIKRLRYTVENFLPQRHERWAKDLRNLQDALGEVHDFDVLRAMITTHPGIQGDEIALWDKRLFGERQKRLQFYRSKMVGRHTLWQQWRSELPTGAMLEKAGLEKLRKWASFLDPDIRHSRLVARLAMALYDGLSHCERVSSARRSRQILYAAAMLHEVGRSKMAGGHGGHQKRARRAVMHLKPPIAWSKEDLQMLAALVRYHRGALPLFGSSHIVAIARERRSELMLLMGVLRLANALDDQHDGKVSRLTVVQQDGAVVLSVQGLPKMSRKAEHVARARYLLETLCGCPFVILEQRARARRFEESSAHR